MAVRLSRRKLLAGASAIAGASAFPMPSIAQKAPFKLGLLTVKTGPLAQGGIQMEQGVLTFLKEKNYMMGGRKVDFVSADTGGNPAGTKTKAQELVERDKVDVILGPLAAFELYAINDYVIQHKTPVLSLAAADDLTQRKPNPYLLRASATSSQAMHPMGHYAATELKLKRVVTVVEDFAFGYEQMGGFQDAFEKDGGCVTKKLWPPLVTPDYTPYVAQISDCDGVCQGFAGSNPLRFMKAYASAGLKYPVVTGETGGDDALLKSFGDEALGLVSCCPYTLDLASDGNQRFVDGIRKDFDVIPGFYAAGLYVNCQVVDAALKATNGDASDKTKFMAALKAVSLTDTPRGPVKFDHLGNVVGTFYVRRIVKEGAKYGLKLWNKTIKTYENVSQFWTWPEKEYLAHPVYSRDYPALRKC
ncbi:MAG: ABC transporter, substrate-binding protein (cluster 4, leucine/isoleucine/valine/benzoate) [Pseudolabrys sp.]|jgi:branched-chain amino acid transport system substrate-binding protein|nr:ABC transporter, substrate-binding protein (cluster 4, leucine/isoleucine/valine/benzoate) [Pseudolabrys sp.]